MTTTSAPQEPTRLPLVKAEAEALGPSESPLREAWRHFRRDRLAMAGLCVLAFLVLVAVFGKILTEWRVVFDPAQVRLPDKLRPPLAGASELIAKDQLPEFGRYLFGTDELGRSVFARMMQGSFVSLSIGIVAVAISLSIGILLGGLAGYYGER